MLKVALASIRGHLVRFLLTALSVTLGVAFVAGTLVLTDSLDRTFTGIFEQANEGLDAYVRGTEGAEAFDGTTLRAPLPLTLEDTLGAVDGVERALPELAGIAVLVGADGTAVRQGGAPTLAFQDVPGDPVLERVAGRAPQGPGEIAVEEDTLAKAGLELGDDTKVVVGAEVLDVTVVSVVRFGALAGSTLVLFDEDTAERLFAPDGTVAAFSVYGADGVTQDELVERLSEVLPAGAEVVTGQAKTDEDTAAITEALGFVSTFLLVFAVISLIVGVFIIVNTFSMLLAQRTRELALLRAIGAGVGQVLRMVLLEAFVVGLVGGLVGLAAGIGLAWVLTLAVGAFGLEMSGGLPVYPSTVVVSLLVGTVVTVLAAALPAVRAARIAPVAAMRDDIALPERGLRVRAGIAAGLLVAGLVAVYSTLTQEGSAANWSLAAAAALLFSAFAVGAAPLVGPVVRFLGAPFAGRSRGVGRMARQNALRNPRRTSVTAGALMIGLALVSAVSILSASATQSTRAIVEETVTADLVLSGGFTGIAHGISDEVREVDGVASVTSVLGVPVQIGQEAGFGLSTRAADIERSLLLPMASGELSSLDDGRLLVSESYAQAHDLAIGDTVTGVIGSLVDTTLTVGGVYEDSLALDSDLLIPWDVATQALPAAQRVDLMALVVLEDGVDVETVREAVVSTVEPFLVISVQDREEFVNAQADQIQQLLVIIYVLLALSLVIAVLGIINTLALSVFERTREIGLLRAVGLTRGQLRRMITVESVLTALFGAVLGTVLGIGLGVLVQRTLADMGLTDLVVPWGTLVVVLVVAALAGVVAAALPAYRAARLNVLRAIATD